MIATYTTIQFAINSNKKKNNTKHNSVENPTEIMSIQGRSDRSGGRLCTRFLGSQVHADGSGPGSQVHEDGSGQGRKGNGLVCTRGQGPYLYTRPRASSVHAEWFCCVYTFVLTAVYFVCSMCAGCQVQVFSSLTAVYFVCSMCAGCQVPNNAF